MFARRMAELQQRQLELRLRNLELRAELWTEARQLGRPLGWIRAAGGVAVATLLLASLRRPGRLLRMIDLAKLGMRVARLFRSFSV
jgi:hypothetical protein